MFKFVIIVLVLFKLNNISGETDYCLFESKDCEKHIGCSKHVPKTHTSITYTIIEFSESAKQTFLNFTNEFKNNMTNGSYEGVGKGANVPVTIWSKELEYFSKRALEFGITENVSTYCSVTDKAKHILYARMHGVEGFESDIIADNLIKRDSQNLKTAAVPIKKTISHWTLIGCAFMIADAYGRKEKDIICVHGFNVEEDKLKTTYDEGKPCSKCDSGLGCDEDYVFLCKQ